MYVYVYIYIYICIYIYIVYRNIPCLPIWDSPSLIPTQDWNNQSGAPPCAVAVAKDLHPGIRQGNICWLKKQFWMRRHRFVFCHLKLDLEKTPYFLGGFSQMFVMFFFSQKFIPHLYWKCWDWSQKFDPETDAAVFTMDKKQLEWCLKCAFWCWWIDECVLMFSFVGFTVYGLPHWLVVFFWAFHQPCHFDMPWLGTWKTGVFDRSKDLQSGRPVTLRPVFIHHIKVWTTLW